MTDPIVDTVAGKVRGRNTAGVQVFRGIPYAGPASAAHRFRPPTPVRPWSGVRDAGNFGPAAPQVVRPHDPPLPDPSSGVFWRLGMGAQTGLALREDLQHEDCLVLNVWTPAADQGRRPVVVWFHGGGWTIGSGARPAAEGSALARHGDVVVVTVNHRIGVLGYLELGATMGPEFAGSGNNGMLDLIAALGWVRDNIALFGGDPGNVTVTGSSGGGSKTWTWLAMPAARGLAHRAIILNGYLMWHRVDLESAHRAASVLLRELGVRPGELDKLLALPAQAFVEAGGRALAKLPPIASFPSTLPEGLWFAPVVDGTTLPESPTTAIGNGSAREMPLLIEKAVFEHFDAAAHEPLRFGWISEGELRQYVRRYLGPTGDDIVDAYRNARPHESASSLLATIVTDANWRMPALRVAEAQGRAGGSAWLAHYALEFGTFTAMLFNNTHLFGGTSISAIAQQVVDAGLQFARSGTPDHAALAHWPAYASSDRAEMFFDHACRVEHDAWREERLAWERSGLR